MRWSGWDTREEFWPSEGCPGRWGIACQSRKQTTHRSLPKPRQLWAPGLGGRDTQGRSGRPWSYSCVGITLTAVEGAPGPPWGRGSFGQQPLGQSREFLLPRPHPLPTRPLSSGPGSGVQVRACFSAPGAASSHPGPGRPGGRRGATQAGFPHDFLGVLCPPPHPPALSKAPSSRLSSTLRAWGRGPACGQGRRWWGDKTAPGPEPRPACCLCPCPRPAFPILCPQGGGVSGPSRCSLSAGLPACAAGCLAGLQGPAEPDGCPQVPSLPLGAGEHVAQWQGPGGAGARRGEGLFVSLSPCVWTHSAPPAPCLPLTPGHKDKADTEQPVAPSPWGPTNAEKTGPAAPTAGGAAWESRSGKPCVVGQHALASETDLRELRVWGPRQR